MAKDNKTLGRFQLTDIPPAPRGVPQIEVEFDIDKNGIVHVAAKDKGTGNEQKITIKSTSGLSEEEIDEMVKDAEEHAEEDKKRVEKIETRNEADALVHQTEKTLDEAGDKVDDSIKEKVEAAKDELKEVLQDEDAEIEAIKEKMEALTDELTELSSELYSQAEGAQAGAGAAGAGAQAGAGQAGPQPGAGASQADDNTVDVDFEEVDEDEEK